MAYLSSTSNTPSRHCAKIARAAMLPYVLSISIMSVGCPLGIPLRFPFDMVNFALLVSFMTSVAHLIGGNSTARHALGFAYPHFPSLVKAIQWPTLKAAAWTLLPGLVAFAALTIAAAPMIAALDNIVVTVMSRITPMYMLGSFVAWRIAVTHSANVSQDTDRLRDIL